MALGAQEETVLGAFGRPDRPDEIVQRRMRRPRAEVEVRAAALRIKAPCDRQSLDQGGFAGAVLAHQEGDLGVELQLVQVTDHRQVEGIGVLVPTLAPFEPGGDPVMLGVDRAHQVWIASPIIPAT